MFFTRLSLSATSSLCPALPGLPWQAPLGTARCDVADRCSLLCRQLNEPCIGVIHIPTPEVTAGRTAPQAGGRQRSPEVTAASESGGPGRPVLPGTAAAGLSTCFSSGEGVKRAALRALGPCHPVWNPLSPGSRAILHGLSHGRWFTQAFFFKASKFIAVHFLIAFTMEIVQIFIVNSTAFERSQSLCYLLQSFMKIYIKLVLF